MALAFMFGDWAGCARWAIPRPIVGLMIFGPLASLSAVHLAVYQARPWALLALCAIPAGGAFVLRRPRLTAAAIVAGSLVLMVGYAGTGYADQTDLGRAALAAILRGETPYQVQDLGSHSNPFAYGPLAMLTAQIGPWLELVSAVLLLSVLAWARAWITLGLVAAFPPFVNLALSGINDYTPALLIVSGLLLVRSRPMLGGVVLGVAGAIKPYAAAWWLLSPWALTGILWWVPVAPYLQDFAAMTMRVSTYTGTPLKWLAIPTWLVGWRMREWQASTLLGAVVFAAVMLFGNWSSLGYWIVVLPVMGLAFESVAHTTQSRTNPLTWVSPGPNPALATVKVAD